MDSSDSGAPHVFSIPALVVPILRVSTLVVSTLMATSVAVAGTFSIAPVRVELSPAKSTEVLTVRNQESTPVVIQASVYEWSQAEGEDKLTDTRDLLSTPPVFTLPAGGEQVVRVARRIAIDSKQERSYRLILQEVLPDAPSSLNGLRIALKISLPIFIAPATPAKAVVVWEARRVDQERLEISAQNTGAAHLQVTDFTIESSPDSRVRQAVSRYVLPGSRITWQLPTNSAQASGTPLKLHAFTDQGEISTEIPLTGN
jgi:fimbrial chaperone protein